MPDLVGYSKDCFLIFNHNSDDRSAKAGAPAMGTLPNATNDFCLELSWPIGKLPVVCTRFGSLAAGRQCRLTGKHDDKIRVRPDADLIGLAIFATE